MARQFLRLHPPGPATGGRPSPFQGSRLQGGCRSRPTRRCSPKCSTHRSTTTSSDRIPMAGSASASNTAPAIVGGPSARTPETSRTWTTSRPPSGPRPRPLVDVLAPRASSQLTSPSGDKSIRFSLPSERLPMQSLTLAGSVATRQSERRHMAPRRGAAAKGATGRTTHSITSMCAR